MLHWIYIVIALYLLVLIVQELFTERRWRGQIALALLVIPLLLRILHIK
jgi:ABC-type phosphate transport system permease subunit